MTYQPPSPSEFKTLIHERLGLTRSQAGKLADVSGNKIGQWSAGKGQVPFSVLATIINQSMGVTISQENWRSEI